MGDESWQGKEDRNGAYLLNTYALGITCRFRHILAGNIVAYKVKELSYGEQQMPTIQILTADIMQLDADAIVKENATDSPHNRSKLRGLNPNQAFKPVAHTSSNHKPL